MESFRQEAFRKLRQPCVELSSVGLKFRGHQASPSDVLKALRPVHDTLNELASKNVLDEKLAEYAFFPLAHIFNEAKRAPDNVLELAVNCLGILVAEGWRSHLSPQMGKQLIILLTLIVGGAPGGARGNRSPQSRAIELDISGFQCLSAIFGVLTGSVAEKAIYHEISTATVVDQTVYILLEGVLSDRSDELCISAANALLALYRRITDRVVLASIMPRTVSSLTKVLKATTQTRRSHKLICICLDILTILLKTVLNDQANAALPDKATQPGSSDERMVLDKSWLKATATQIKLALTNVIQLRRHERHEVKEALLNLCIMVIEDCPNTLQDSMPILLETVVVLSDLDEDQVPNNAYSSLKHLATTYPTVLDSLKNSVHTWLMSFPRTMQNNDETKKQWAIKQISIVFQIISEIQSTSEILTTSLASGLCDSVAAIVQHTSNALQPLNAPPLDNQTLEVVPHGNEKLSFSPVLLDHKSQQQTRKDLQSMITSLNMSESGNHITRFIINRIHQEHGNSILAPLWLATRFLNGSSQFTSTFDEFISLDYVEPSRPSFTRANMIDELYSISLPILNEPLADESRDWRVSALALEAVALQADQLGSEFRPELMDALYPVLQLLASNNPVLQRHSMACLDILSKACNYEDTSTMIIENVDYLVNSVALKLNTFDVSPYPPQVLLMMVKLCGGRLIPYLDDLVDSIFGILDLYHGYPKLVEMMFKTLATIVEEGARSPSLLAIEHIKDGEISGHLKKKYQPLQISTLAEDFSRRKSKRVKYRDELEGRGDIESHPNQPWSEASKEALAAPTPEVLNKNFPDAEESDEPLPPPREPEDAEKPLSKSHTILIHIVKSVPSHLSSPSPYLRRSLLSILIDVVPVLAANENSFLPLVNDLWPSILARITFPSYGSSSSSANPLAGTDISRTKDDRAKQEADAFDFQEEIFVTVAACKVLEIMFQCAGDFMASRVESEFPRWERFYKRAWETVSQDADRVADRRARQHAKNDPLQAEPGEKQLPDPFAPVFIQSLSLTKIGTTSGSRAFTPHHNLWRAFTSLFLTLLTHVRLPLPVGDKICEMFGEWIAQYAGPTYYFSRSSVDDQQKHAALNSASSEPESIQSVIRAMETWNSDLTWFIFQQQRAHVSRMLPTKKTSHEQIFHGLDRAHSKLWSHPFPGGRVTFAAMIL